MKSTSYSLIITSLFSFYTFSQSDSSKISVLVDESKNALPISDAKVYFHTEKDTLQVDKTDSQGKCSFTYNLEIDKAYYISVEVDSFNNYQKSEIVKQNSVPTEFMVEISFNNCSLHDDQNQIVAFYNENDVDSIDFDFSILREIIKEYPHVNFKVTSLFTNSESEKVSDLRLRKFKRKLEKNQIELKRFNFLPSKENNIIQVEGNFKPCIFIEIVSL